MTVLACGALPYNQSNKMPEFEETNSQPDPSHSYTPSTDASSKPRTRRRSGGFKTEVSSSSTASMGEVSAADALKQEKLSGSARPQQERVPRDEAKEEAPQRAQREPRAPRDREERAPREPRAERTPREPRQQRAPREPREERITNPQPSEETLAAIKRVEASMTERRAERDARRKEREKNRPERTERPARNNERKNAGDRAPRKNAPAKAAKKGGLLAAISGFFGKLIGNEPEKKPAAKRGGQKRDGRPQNRGGNRGGQNRGGQGRRQGGKRGGQGRRQGGGEQRHTATSRSNES